MANEFKVKKGLIVDGTNTVLDIQGTQGQLFSVTDSLTGDLFSVSDISGIPILNVNSSGLVTVDGDAHISTNLTVVDSISTTKFHDTNNTDSWLDIRDTSGNYHLKAHEGGMYFDAPVFYFREFSNAGQKITIDAGTATATSSFRAPIFYDSNDTNYYVNPGATDYSGVFRQHVTIGDSAQYKPNSGSWGARLNVVDNVHAKITVGQDADSMLSVWYAHTGQTSAKFGTETGHNLDFITGNTTRLSLDLGGNVIATGSLRAPIFYDSNDTAYYTNPASTSNLNGLTVNSTISGTTSGNWSYSGINAGRNIVLGTDLDTDLDAGGTFSSYGSSNTSWNAPQSYGGVVGYAFSSGIKGQQFFDIRHNNSDYSDYWFRSKNNLGFTPWAKVWHNLNDGAGSGLVADTVSSIKANTGLLYDKLRAPGHIDGLTTTNFRTTLFGAATHGPQISAARWQTTPSALSGMSNYGTMLSWANSDTQGFIATEYSGAGRIKVGGGNGDGINYVHELITNSSTSQTKNGVFQSDTSLRAPIFYDSNDTNYYIDPSTTNTSLNANGSIKGDYFVGSKWNTKGYTVYKGYDNFNHFISVRGYAQPGQGKTDASIVGMHITSFVEYTTDSSSGWFFMNSSGTNYEQIAKITKDHSVFLGSARAPLFYDSNNTTYYINPAGQSIMQRATHINTSTPILIKVNSGYKSWVHHVATSDDYIIAPSATDGGEDWDWANQTSFSTSGVVKANNFVLSSDKRSKTKIEDLTGDNVDISWKSFEMKGNEGEYRTGVIAQELEENHPEFVNTDEKGFKSVKYIDLLIAKIAELEARLEKLEK